MNAVISITGMQSGESGDSDIIELMTDGEYRHSGDESYIEYYESEITGLEGTKTSVSITPGQVILERSGNLISRMVFREGEKNRFLYDTRFGAATMGVDTRRIDARFDENGGELCVDYVVDMEHAAIGRNKIRMSVKKAGS